MTTLHALAHRRPQPRLRAATSWHCFGLVPYPEQNAVVRGATVVEAGGAVK